jgi:hypothetical protein
MDTDEEVSIMKVPGVVFREYRWRVKIIKERGNIRFDNGMLG